MDVKYIQNKLSDFAKKRDWEKFHNLKNLAISINIESSELLEIFQWENDLEIKKKIKKTKFKERVSDEVADVLLYLLRFSEIAKLDLEKICVKKIKKNAKKYPIKLSKGKSDKYTSFEWNKWSLMKKNFKKNQLKLAKALKENIARRKEKKNGNNAWFLDKKNGKKL